jgi:lysophospholipase L1-like esterase
MALGDSLAFGYTNQKFYENLPGELTSNNEGGYVDAFYKKLAAHEKAAGNALQKVNFGCPGELTTGLIGNGPLGTALEGAKVFSGGTPACLYHKVLAASLGIPTPFPLHNPIGSGSQLEAALGVLAGPTPVKAITINIGANDELKKVKDCTNPTYLGEHGFTGFLECVTTETPALFGKIIHNTGVTISTLRNSGKYAGPIIILGFYNPQSFVLPGSDILQMQLNNAFEESISKGLLGPGVKYGNPFKRFNPQNKTESEKICKYTEMCNPFDIKQNEEKVPPVAGGDIHPTPAGYKELGRILFMSSGL